MDAYASKASQGQMIASAMGRQMVSRREQFYSTSVEDRLNELLDDYDEKPPKIPRLQHYGHTSKYL